MSLSLCKYVSLSAWLMNPSTFQTQSYLSYTIQMCGCFHSVWAHVCYSSLIGINLRCLRKKGLTLYDKHAIP